MSDNTGDGAVTPSSASAGVSAEMKQELQKIVMGIVKDIVPRAIKQSMTESSDALLDQLAEKMISSAAGDEAAKPANGGEPQQDRLTMKALQQKLDEMQRGLKERDEQIKTERARATELRLKTDVRDHFARHLGADSPHLDPYVNHFLSQFSDYEGKTSRKVKNEYGEETYVPAAQAIDELFKGDLKHLIAPQRPAGLPPTGLVRGQPVGQQQQRGENFMTHAMRQLATANPELAPIISTGNNNGQPK